MKSQMHKRFKNHVLTQVHEIKKPGVSETKDREVPVNVKLDVFINVKEEVWKSVLVTKPINLCVLEKKCYET